MPYKGKKQPAKAGKASKRTPKKSTVEPVATRTSRCQAAKAAKLNKTNSSSDENSAQQPVETGMSNAGMDGIISEGEILDLSGDAQSGGVSAQRSLIADRSRHDEDGDGLTPHTSRATKVVTKGGKTTNITFEENNNFVDMEVSGSISSEGSSSDESEMSSEDKSVKSSDEEVKLPAETAVDDSGSTSTESDSEVSPPKRKKK